MYKILIHENGNSPKFWVIETIDKSLITKWGKLHYDGQSSSKEFDDKEKCEKEGEKLIAKKIKEGYEEIQPAIPHVAIHSLKQLSDAKKGKTDSIRISYHSDEPAPKELFEEICSIKELKDLAIEGDNIAITELNSEIGKLTNLTKLQIRGKRISSIPKEIGNLTNLEELEISDTFIEVIPSEIKNLKNLIKLNINSNKKLKCIPEEIGELTSLKSLWAYNYDHTGQSGFKTLPESLWNLPNLITLNIQGNQLTQLSKNIKNLKELYDMDISQTRIRELPKELSQLEKLKFFKAKDCPITNVPPQVLKEKINIIKEYLASDGESFKLPEQKRVDD